MPTILSYIDPGTGSFLLQVLFAGVLGGLAAIKIFWARITGAVTSIWRARGGGKQS